MNKIQHSAVSAVQFSSTPAPALHALLQCAIDFAGLFPPAELALEPALKNHAAYVRSDGGWMLNSFVLPVGQFPTARPFVSWFDSEHPLRISALGAKSGGGTEFNEKVSAAATSIHELPSATDSSVSVVQLEMALPPNPDLHMLGALHELSTKFDLRVFCEAPPAEAERTIALLAQFNTSRDTPLGYKLRTGGVTADAFPTSSEIARALIAAVRDHVPIKFTAGLHHPVRQFRDEVQGKMHGFVNVLGAGVLAAEHGWNEGTTVEMLEDEESRSFLFEHDTFGWRQWNIGAEKIRSWRDIVTSFGSCSFNEPRDDLRTLHLL